MRLLAAALALTLSGLSHAITAEELITKNIESHGGLAALKAIESTTATGKMTFSNGDFSLDLALKVVQSRPGNSRMEATFQGMTMVNAFDGKDSWTISPFQGRVDPQRNSGDEAKMAKINADLDGQLVDYKAKGYTVEYLGMEDVDGTNAHKLRVRLNATDSRTFFLDPDYFLEIRFEDRFQMRGAEIVVKTDVGDYEKVNGWFMPFYSESQGQKISFDTIVANSKIDASQFAFPAAPKK
jgi:outer membrane lipoprotein-sorting protein